MIRTRRFAAIFVPVFLLLIAVQGLARGQTTPAKLYLAPNVAAPGGEIVLSGHGFTPGYLPNFTASSDTDEYDLGPASADPTDSSTSRRHCRPTWSPTPCRCLGEHGRYRRARPGRG